MTDCTLPGFGRVSHSFTGVSKRWVDSRTLKSAKDLGDCHSRVTNPSATRWSEAGWLKKGKSDITMTNVQCHGWAVLNPTGEHVGPAWNIFVSVMSPSGTKGAEACVHQLWSVTG